MSRVDELEKRVKYMEDCDVARRTNWGKARDVRGTLSERVEKLEAAQRVHDKIHAIHGGHGVWVRVRETQKLSEGQKAYTVSSQDIAGLGSHGPTPEAAIDKFAEKIAGYSWGKKASRRKNAEGLRVNAVPCSQEQEAPDGDWTGEGAGTGGNDDVPVRETDARDIPGAEVPDAQVLNY